MDWMSTPFYGGKSAAHLLLQLAVLMAGMTWHPFELGLGFVNICVGSSSAFFNHQRQYASAVNEYFQDEMARWRDGLREHPMSIAIDVRYDSPG
jgi:hypothetical protein